MTSLNLTRQQAVNAVKAHFAKRARFVDVNPAAMQKTPTVRCRTLMHDMPKDAWSVDLMVPNSSHPRSVMVESQRRGSERQF
jgi:hypothetical protein